MNNVSPKISSLTAATCLTDTSDHLLLKDASWSYEISEAQATRWFWIFAFIHGLLWTLMPTLFRISAPFDSLEGLIWGNQWQLGYAKHPFLAPWLTAGFVHLCHAIDWPIYLLSQITVIICFWAMWRIAAAILKPLPALASIFILEGVYYYNIATPQFNPNTLMLATWALTNLSYYKAVTIQQWRYWLATGFCAGLAMLTKYEAPLLLISLCLFMVINPIARKNFATAKPYIAILICLTVFSPNLWWLVHQHFIALTYADNRLESHHIKHISGFAAHIYQPTRFIIEQLLTVLPAFILAIPLLFSPRSKNNLSSFNWQFILIVGWGPFSLSVLLSVITGDWLNGMWALPFFSFFGIIIMAWWQPLIKIENLRRFLVIVISIFSLTAVSDAIYLGYSAVLFGHANDSNYPGRELAAIITDKWQATYQKKLSYIAGSDGRAIKYIAGYSSDSPQPYFFWDPKFSPWINENRMKQAGAVFIWRVKSQKDILLKPNIAARFPQTVFQGVIKIPVVMHGPSTKPNKLKPIVIAYAFLPPG